MVGPLQPKRSGCLLFQGNGAREQDVVLKVDVLVQVSLEVLQRRAPSVVAEAYDLAGGLSWQNDSWGKCACFRRLAGKLLFGLETECRPCGYRIGKKQADARMMCFRPAGAPQPDLACVSESNGFGNP